MAVIEARLILEILGKPIDHVRSTLRGLVDKLAAEKGVTIISHTLHEPALVKDTKDLFTSFADVEVHFDSLLTYFGIIFAYMPSNIEIMSPQSFKLSNEEFSGLGSQLLNRLHLYESVTKRLIGDRNVLLNRLKEAGIELPAEALAPVAPAQDAAVTKAPKKKKKKR